ncbi:MAG: hypothetical protein HY517_03175 [Candidatus Aenigmarchaeota archaeon]|nr:hypothetical protein [Candidatus Aenigmarchaeota archaeon]
MTIPVYSVKVADYSVRKKPDHAAIGAKIDKVIKKHFLGRRVAIRCLGSQEHKGKSANDLIRIIKKLGTDKYDLLRTGEKYENIEGKRIDLFALDFKITKSGKFLENFIEPFYDYPLAEGKKPVRIDIIILYDMTKLKRVLHRYEGRKDVKRDGFVFRNTDKRAALLGIIKVL